MTGSLQYILQESSMFHMVVIEAMCSVREMRSHDMINGAKSGIPCRFQLFHHVTLQFVRWIIQHTSRLLRRENTKFLTRPRTNCRVNARQCRASALPRLIFTSSLELDTRMVNPHIKSQSTHRHSIHFPRLEYIRFVLPSTCITHEKARLLPAQPHP
jgi:hypothetical protein